MRGERSGSHSRGLALNMKLAVTDLISSGSRALRVTRNDSIGATRSIHRRGQVATTLVRMMGEVAAVRAGSVLASVVLMSASVACTELDPETDNCISVGTSNCEPPPVPDSGDEDPLFWCLPDGEPEFVPPETPSPFVNYVVAIIDANVPNPNVQLPNLQIRACLDMDFNCSAPLPSIVLPVPGAPAALTSILVPRNANVTMHLRLTADGYVESHYYFGGPMIGAPEPIGSVENFTVPEALAPALMAATGMTIPAGTVIPVPTVRGENLAMVRDSQIESFFQTIAQGEPRDTMAGIIALRMIDCNGDRAPGVSLDPRASIGDGFGFVLPQNNVPARTDVRDIAGPTVPGDGGGAGFANVPRGGYLPVGVLEGGRTYGGLISFNVQPNVLTNGEVRPSYAYGR